MIQYICIEAWKMCVAIDIFAHKIIPYPFSLSDFKLAKKSVGDLLQIY
jgi:hypothetical protein